MTTMLENENTMQNSQDHTITDALIENELGLVEEAEQGEELSQQMENSSENIEEKEGRHGGKKQADKEDGEKPKTKKRGNKRVSSAEGWEEYDENSVPSSVPDEAYSPEDTEYHDEEPKLPIHHKATPVQPKIASTAQIAPLDAEGRAITDRRSTAHQDIVALSAAMRSKKVLAGTLTSFETERGEMPRAHVMYGNVTVVIPFEEMGIALPAEEQQSSISARLYINGLLGAKIYFLVLGVDVDSRVAVASRSKASELRRKQILGRKNRQEEYVIQKHSLCTAQIISVTSRIVRVDIYGYETRIALRDISNLWIQDLKEMLQIGDEHIVEITELQRDEGTEEVVSLKAKMNLGQEQEVKSLAIGQTYTGKVTNWSNNSYFVRVADIPTDVRCPMDYMYEMRPLEENDEVRFFVRYLRRDGAAVGCIMKLLKKHKPLEW